MSTELAIANERGQSMAELMGVSSTPATSNPLGSKGCGEAGTIAATPAVMNAVIDAIGTDVSMPATAEKVWKALRKSGSKKEAA